MTRLYIALALFLVLCGTHFYAYQKGKDSVFKGIISGQATFQKKQEEAAKEDVRQTTVDTRKITKLEKERDSLRQQLEKTRSPSGLSGDALRRVQQAVRDANEDTDSLPPD